MAKTRRLQTSVGTLWGQTPYYFVYYDGVHSALISRPCVHSVQVGDGYRTPNVLVVAPVLTLESMAPQPTMATQPREGPAFGICIDCLNGATEKHRESRGVVDENPAIPLTIRAWNRVRDWFAGPRPDVDNLVQMERCRWHDERTPSCVVNRVSGKVYCFGCGRSATVEEWDACRPTAG